MPEITSYVPGLPSWVDLSTTDEKGALMHEYDASALVS